MRLFLALALLLAIAVGAAVLVLTRDDGAAQEAGSVTLVGDSLNVGIEPYLAKELPGWHIDRHDRIGRATPEGIAELRRLAGSLGSVVVVSLGTNDPDGSEGEFGRLVHEAIAVAGADRCLVWATIVRDGAGRSGFDDILTRARSENGNLRLVDWSRMVARDRSLLSGDAVHATPDGYARRAAETARAIRSCPA